MTIQRRHRIRAQSTVEFALMMPVIMAFFFWIFQVNIYYSALNQSAWAAYSAARTHLVMGGPDSNKVSPDKTIKRILTGSLYDQGAPTVSTNTLRSGGGADGVIVKLKALDTLPYVSTNQNGRAPLLEFDTEVSTHLGWQEYDKSKYSDDYERENGGQGKGGSKTVTDNNLTDY